MEAGIISVMMAWSIFVLVTWIGDDLKKWKKKNRKRMVRRCVR